MTEVPTSEWVSLGTLELLFSNYFKVLSQACGVILKGKLQDPKTANWLLDPGAKEKNFLQMVEHFLPQESNLLQGKCNKS